jgi:hypothetical protein
MELVPVVTDTRIHGAPLATDFSISYGPPASHNVNYVLLWLKDDVAAQKKLLDKVLDLSTLLALEDRIRLCAS